MEKQTIIYSYVTGWCKGADSEEVTGDGRTTVTLVLGEYKSQGVTQDYIGETIYENVLNDIMRNPKDYEIKVQVGVTPQLIVISNGMLVLHNEEIAQHRKELLDTLKQIDAETINDAYLELRLNMNGKTKLGAATNILAGKIEKIGGRRYSNVFIRAVINTMVEDQFYSTEDNEMKEWMRSLDYEDLVSLSNSLIRFKSDQTIEDEMLRTLCEESGKEPPQFMKGVEIVLGQELVLRLYKGTIMNRQTARR